MPSRIFLPRVLSILAGASALAIILLTSVRQIDTPDLFFHLALGDQVLAGHWPPDLSRLYFSPIAAGWADDFRNTFVGDTLLAATHRLGGLVAIQLLGAGLLVASGLCFWRASKRRSINDPPSATPNPVAIWACAAVFVLATIQLQTPRNAVFSLLFVPLSLFGTDRFLRSGNWKILASLALFFALWTTIHASFLLGLVLTATQSLGAILGAGREASDRPTITRRSAILLVALFLACLPANPHLFHYLSIPAHRLTAALLPQPTPPPQPQDAAARQRLVPADLGRITIHDSTDRERRNQQNSAAPTAPDAKPTATPSSVSSDFPAQATPSLAARTIDVLLQPIWRSSGDGVISGDFLPSWRSLRYLPVTAALLLGLYALIRLLAEPRDRRLCRILPLLVALYFAICYVRGTGYLALVSVWCLTGLRHREGLRPALGTSAVLASILLFTAVTIARAVHTGTLGSLLGENTHTFGLGGSPMIDPALSEFVANENPHGRTFTTILSGSFALPPWQSRKTVFVDAFIPAHSAAVWESYLDAQLVRSVHPLFRTFDLDSAVVENCRSDWQDLFLDDPRFHPVALGLGLTYFLHRTDNQPPPPLCEILFTPSELQSIRNIVIRQNAAAQILNVHLHLLRSASPTRVTEFELRYARLIETARRLTIPPSPASHANDDLKPLYR